MRTSPHASTVRHGAAASAVSRGAALVEAHRKAEVQAVEKRLELQAKREKQAAAAAELTALAAEAAAQSASRPASTPLVAIGVLTMPVLVRSPNLRSWHRAVHRAQVPARSGEVLVRYVVSDAEEAQVSNASAFAAFTQEKATYHDLITVPAVPRGRLRQLLSTSPPDGGGCVLKILSWLQHAARALPLVETAVCPL